MTPNLLALDIFAVAAVSLLALFAKRNKRMGWVKPRATFVDDLRALQAAFNEEDQLALQHKPVRTEAPSLAEVGAFTNQLTKLQGALGGRTVVVTAEERVEELTMASK